MSKKVQAQVLHELNAQGQHRLVVVGLGGTSAAGEWFSQGAFATNGKLWACADPSLGLPEVFTVAERAHQVLS